MKVLVTGANGQLGHDVVDELLKRNHLPIKCDIVGDIDMVLDITGCDKVNEEVINANPDAIIHCAAWTAVDNAEDEDKKDKVYSINVIGTKNIVDASIKLNIPVLYLSTDYVFNGNGSIPWIEDDKPNPINYYGYTKYLGEEEIKRNNKHYIVRIAWVFGVNGNNFPKTMIKLSKTHKELRVVNDQIGSPTYTPDLAKLLVDMIEVDKYGTYHVTNDGEYISWYEYTKEIFKIANINDVNVIPVTSEEYGLSKAKRPSNSRLNREKYIKNGFYALPHWKDALKDYIEKLGD